MSILLPLVLSVATHAQLDQQARQQANSFWNARITKCGEDFYTRDRNYIHHFRNPRIEVRAGRVSSADRLNGIEYDGFTSFKTELSRTYSPKSTLYQDAGWSKWSNGFTGSMGGGGLAADVRKVNGSWNVTPHRSSQAVVLKPVDCSNLLGTDNNANNEPGVISVPFRNYAGSSWDEYGVGVDEARNGGNAHIWMRASGIITYHVKLTQPRNDLTVTVRLSSELKDTTHSSPSFSSDVTLVVNDKAQGIRNVISDDGIGRDYQWLIPKNSLRDGINLITFRVGDGEYKNGIAIYSPIRLRVK